MLTYFGYLSLNFLKKKTTWVSAVLFWVYIALAVAIIPKILNVNPISIWNNTIMDVSSYTLTLLAIVCAVFSVIIFRDGRDDGSELIIISKPISRAKIVATKFIAFFVWTTLIVIISLLIIASTAAFGQNSVDNPSGMDLEKLPGLVLSTFIGSMIVILLFGAIAIFISMITGKIGVIVGTVGITVFLNLFYVIAPVTVSSPKDYLQSNQGVNLNSCQIVDTSGKQSSVTWRANEVDKSEQDKTAYDWAQIGLDKSSVTEIAIMNVEAQMCQIYKAFGVEDDDAIGVRGFGVGSDRKFIVNNKRYVDDSMEIPSHDNAIPLFSLRYVSQYGRESLRYYFVGTNIEDFTIYSVLGQKAESFGLVLVMGQDIGAKFYNWKELNQPRMSDPKIVQALNTFYASWITTNTSSLTTNKFRKDIYDIMSNNVDVLWGRDNIDQITSEQLNFTFLSIMLQLLIKTDNDLIKEVDALKDIAEYNKKISAADPAFRNKIYLARDYLGVGTKNNGFYDSTNRPVGSQNDWDPDQKSEITFGAKYAENWKSITDLYEYTVDRQFSSLDIIAFWSLFSLFLYMIAIIVYTKTDFK